VNSQQSDLFVIKAHEFHALLSVEVSSHCDEQLKAAGILNKVRNSNNHQ
jgi:hypothetical protein